MGSAAAHLLPRALLNPRAARPATPQPCHDIRKYATQGTYDPATGEVNLEFLADFDFTAGPIYKAPSLLVRTTLTTESSTGRMKSATGKRLVDNSGT